MAAQIAPAVLRLVEALLGLKDEVWCDFGKVVGACPDYDLARCLVIKMRDDQSKLFTDAPRRYDTSHWRAHHCAGRAGDQRIGSCARAGQLERCGNRLPGQLRWSTPMNRHGSVSQ